MMEFSCSYHKRKHYMKKLQVPTISEAKRQLGNDLAQVLMDECPEALKERFSLTNPLKGPGSMLWVSPSDILIGRVVLSPPLTSKYMKALTHEGILEFGAEIEAQWMAAVELEKSQALDNLEELMMLLAEREKERAIQAALAASDAKFQNYMQTVNAEFENVLIAELASLEASLRAFYENLIEEQIAECHEQQEGMVNDRIDNAVNATVQELTQKFLADLEAQEKDLEAIFQARLSGQLERFKHSLQYQEDVFTIVMKQLKHNLQCNNIASLMYVLCIERRKCAADQTDILNSVNQQMYQLEQKLEENRQEAHNLKCELKLKQKQLTLREDCLLGVICQFQKFINFALKAAPTQAEFLLNVEKMMTFELAQALERTQKGRKPHLARMLMPWRKISQQSVVGEEVFHYHNCLNELDPPKKELDDLLAVSYKNRTYVREDFRNKVLQEPYKKPSNMLWSKDVEDLVNLIRKVNDELVEAESSVNELHMPDSVHFLTASLPDPVGLLAVKDSLQETSIRRGSSIESKSPSDMSKVKSPLQLLAAADSITLLRDRNLSLVKTKPGSSEVELHMIEAPSNVTLQLRKEARRVTVTQNDSLSVQNLSDVTIQLNKNKISMDSSPLISQVPTSSLRMPAKSASVAKQVKRTRSHKSSEIRASAIHQHVDSLELIARNASSRQLKLKNLIMPKEFLESGHAIQRCIVNAPADSRDYPEVNFKRVAEMFSKVYKPQEPWKIYNKNKKMPSTAPVKPPVAEKRKNFLKQEPVANIVGNRKVDKDQSFTVHRIHSIMDILKKDDSLIRMFTRCTQ